MIVTYSYASLNIFSSSDDLQPEYEILYNFVATAKLEIIMLLRLIFFKFTRTLSLEAVVCIYCRSRKMSFRIVDGFYLIIRSS